jgi:hypothetical protein
MKKFSAILLGLLAAAVHATSGALLPTPSSEFSVNTFPGPMDLPEPPMMGPDGMDFEIQGVGDFGYGNGGGLGYGGYGGLGLGGNGGNGGGKNGGYGVGASIATIIPLGGGGGGGKHGPGGPGGFGGGGGKKGGNGGGIGAAIILPSPIIAGGLSVQHTARESLMR